MDETANVTVTTENTTAESTEAETTVETQAATAEESIVMSIDEFNKRIQSASSKAKNAILQELNVKSISEFNNLKQKYDDTIANATKLQEEITSLKEELILSKADVRDDVVSDVITLAKSKVTSDTDFDKAVQDVLAKNPTWRKTAAPIKMGTDKQNSASNEASAVLKSKYGWL